MSSAENIDTLWKRFSSGLRSFIFSKVKNTEDTDDILQEMFIRMHANIGALKDSSRIKPWLYQIARNLIADHFRDKAGKYGKNVIPLRTTGISSVKSMDEAISDMVKMMDELPSEYCEALCMTEIDGMSQKDYAEKSGLSYSGAKSRVQRARSMLKDMLLDCCHYQFDKYGTVFRIESKCCRCCSPSGKT